MIRPSLAAAFTMLGTTMLATTVLATTVLATAALPAQDPTAAPGFEQDVLPILRAACVDCHKARYEDERGRLRKPKGALRLDGKAWILAGGDGGPAVVPGKPERSPLYTRTILPPDDFDIMPEEGDPLSQEQTEVLRRWIAAGAPFGDWIGATGPAGEATPAPATPTAHEQLLGRLAAGVAPPSARALDKALGEHGRADPLDPEGRLLRVSWPAHRETVDDRTVTALQAISRNVVVLDLRGAERLDDLRALRRFDRLLRLDLTGADIDAADLAALRGLAELRSLVLVGTRVGPQALGTVQQLPALQSVYLWRTPWQPADLKRLREARPGLRVVGAPALPPSDGD